MRILCLVSFKLIAQFSHTVDSYERKINLFSSRNELETAKKKISKLNQVKDIFKYDFFMSNVLCEKT